MPRPAIRAFDISRWETAIIGIVVGDRQRNLFQVSDHDRLPGSVSGMLNCRNQNRPDQTEDQDNDRHRKESTEKHDFITLAIADKNWTERIG